MADASKHYAFFQNRECEYFPCHDGIDPGRFNCLFCYCPLYALGRRCGGNFHYNGRGVKDCSRCAVPHEPENYGRVIGCFQEIVELVRRTDADRCDLRNDITREKEL